MSEVKGPSAFVNDAYHLESRADMVAFYKKWADDYDRQMLDELGYVSPYLIADMLSEALPQKDSQVFDIGCGTGLTCKLLAGRGYTQLDGIDISPDMIRVARERGIYRKLLIGDVNEVLQRDDSSYDGVICSGTFTHGHVGPGPLDEVFRILRPGGILACTVHHDLWESLGFNNKLEKLTSDGTATCLTQREDKYYETGELEGWFCVYQKNG